MLKSKLGAIFMPSEKRLPKLSLFFFKRPKLMAFIWIALLSFGILSYTTFMGRQGFPPVQAPLSIVTGTYLVEDPKRIDTEVNAPISEIALQQPEVKTVTATANSTTFNLFIQYKDGTEPLSTTKKLEAEVRSSGKLPKDASANFQTIDVSKFSPQGEGFDILISVYDPANRQPPEKLVEIAKTYSVKLNAEKLSLVDSTKLIDPFSEGVNPQTGQTQKVQIGFDRYGQRTDSKTVFYNDVVIGLKAKKGTDAVRLYRQVNESLNRLNSDKQFSGYQAKITAAFAPQIEQNINELQKTLLEGLVSILVVGTILISLRASILIILSMVTVIFLTFGLIYLVGYTINVITLFAVILGLALIVDDTIIMTEALDVERRRQKTREAVVKAATNKVSLAMLAATSTAALAFAPLVFISGILGGFIRPIPVTIITALIISLIAALTVIPFLARFLILRQKNIGANVRDPLPVRLQEAFAHKLTAPLRWSKKSNLRLWTSGAIAFVIGLGFIFGGIYIFKYLTFNIFPPNKDSDLIQIMMQFPAGTDIQKAEATADKVNQITVGTLGDNFKDLTYYASGTTNQAQVVVNLKHYTDRKITSPQLVDRLKEKFKNFNEATLSVTANDVGGPPGGFNVLIDTPDRTSALALGQDLANYLHGKTLKRLDGSTAHISSAVVSNPDAWLRKDNKQVIQVSAAFDAEDTSTLVTLAKELVQKQYTNEKLAKYNLSSKNLIYDFGFEEENQKSFNSMMLAFPLLLVIMYLLLAFEFKSLLQPILIFMAVPFSFFGITGGLWLTDNPFSFFTMLGFFALVGLSIKNTILLTDYANQARRAGFGRVDAIAAALEERFRPLLATSVTAVFSLLPLALTSPFWESLAFTLIFGLISSTLLVLLVFPYFYLGGEYLRMRISRVAFLTWLVANAGAIIIVGIFSSVGTAVQFVVIFNLLRIGWWVLKKFWRRK